MSLHTPYQSVSRQQLLAYGMGGIIPIAIFNIAGQLVGLMGNTGLGLSAFWLGFILIIPRLWDAVSDPLVGYISDNTSSPWGRRRPYLLFGGIFVAVTFVLIWWVPKGQFVLSLFPNEELFQWFQLSYILFFLLLFFTACTIFEIPHGALGMEMTTHYNERTRLFSAKSFLGNIFAMGTPWLYALANMELFTGAGGNEIDGMRYISIFVAVFVILLSFWWFFVLQEPSDSTIARAEKIPFWQNMKWAVGNKTFIRVVAIYFILATGFNLVSLLNYYISIFYLYGGDKAAAGTLLGINGTIWAITGVLAVFPLNWLSKWFEKKQLLLLSIILMSAAQLAKIVCYSPDYPYLIIIPTILLSAGMLFFFTLGPSMIADICDEEELATGHHSEGSYYAVYWWFLKMGMAIASFVTGALIVTTQFDETQVSRVDHLAGSISAVEASAEYWKNTSTLDSLTIREKTQSTFEKIQFLEMTITNMLKDISISADAGHSQNIWMDYHKALDMSRIRINMLHKALEGRVENAPNKSDAPLNIDDNGNVFDARQEIFILISQIDLEQIRLDSIILLAHFSEKAGMGKPNAEHYQGLKRTLSDLDQHLTQIIVQAQSGKMTSQSLLTSVLSLKKTASSLTRQAPKTLFLMRALEIGLPLILCLLSSLLVLHYPLTRARYEKIKQALELKRHSQK